MIVSDQDSNLIYYCCNLREKIVPCLKKEGAKLAISATGISF